MSTWILGPEDVSQCDSSQEIFLSHPGAVVYTPRAGLRSTDFV